MSYEAKLDIPPEVLAAFPPSEGRLFEAACDLVNVDLLEEIAGADYGQEFEQHLAALTELHQLRRIERELDWYPLEVLQLMGYLRPEAERGQPGSPGVRGHKLRFFSRAAIITARGSITGYENDSLAALIESGLALDGVLPEAVTRFITAWLQSSDAFDQEETPFFAFGLLAISMLRPTQLDRPLIDTLIPWVLEMDSRCPGDTNAFRGGSFLSQELVGEYQDIWQRLGNRMLGLEYGNEALVDLLHRMTVLWRSSPSEVFTPPQRPRINWLPHGITDFYIPNKTRLFKMACKAVTPDILREIADEDPQFPDEYLEILESIVREGDVIGKVGSEGLFRWQIDAKYADDADRWQREQVLRLFCCSLMLISDGHTADVEALGGMTASAIRLGKDYVRAAAQFVTWKSSSIQSNNEKPFFIFSLLALELSGGLGGPMDEFVKLLNWIDSEVLNARDYYPSLLGLERLESSFAVWQGVALEVLEADPSHEEVKDFAQRMVDHEWKSRY